MVMYWIVLQAAQCGGKVRNMYEMLMLHKVFLGNLQSMYAYCNVYAIAESPFSLHG
jgi:hypothetical protein